MSKRSAEGRAALQSRAIIFAALGDPTRLAVLGKLLSGEAQSIARLTEGSGLTRQAVSKHLGVLEAARIVTSTRAGRETLYALRPEPIDDIRAYLDRVSRQWDDALARLKAFVEVGPA